MTVYMPVMQLFQSLFGILTVVFLPTQSALDVDPGRHISALQINLEESIGVVSLPPFSLHPDWMAIETCHDPTVWFKATVPIHPIAEFL